MIELLNPPTIAAPASRYSHAAVVAPNARWLVISGQVGVAPDGTIENGIEAQTERVWQNTLAVLEAANMGVENIVKATAFLLERAHLPVYRRIRDAHLGAHAAASTLYFVAGLAHPDWLIEMETVAAAP